MPSFAKALALSLSLALAGTAAQAEQVDVELVLLVDVSGSINDQEHLLQKQGHADAFRDPGLHRAVAGGWLGRIAATYVEWDGSQTQVVGWHRLESPADAHRFADAILKAPRHAGLPTTSIAKALAYAPGLFGDNGFQGIRRVIDISGDGAENTGGEPRVSRELALASGVTTINGIVIPNEVGVEDYYETNVIGGGGSFLVIAEDFTAFQQAILDKLIREIAGTPSPPRLVHRAARPREVAMAPIAD